MKLPSVSSTFKLVRAHLTLPVILVILATATYTSILTWLSLLKYESFHATFGDLGLNNHILWLLSHGGYSEYSQSGFASVYPFTIDKPIYFLLTPFYALDPTISFLLVLQSVVLGFAALPLFLFTRRRAHSEWIGALVSISYLLYFPVAGGNLFDWHEMSFCPLFFFSMLYFWSVSRPFWMYVFALLYASIDPLALVTVFLFVLFLPIESSGWKREISGLIGDLFRGVAGDRVRLAFLSSLLALLVLYSLLGGVRIGGVGIAPAGTSPLAILLYSVNAKITLFLFLLGALAFLPLFDRLALVTLLPYAGFVFYSTDSSNWAIFGLAYPLLAVGPLYLGVANVLARRLTLPQSPTSASSGVESRSVTANRRFSLSHATPPSAEISALVLVTVVFGGIYFPVSPVNQYVSGGYWSGNHQFQDITSITPEDEFLDRVIGLIPANAGVLTQNDIPQVSGREYYVVDEFYSSSIPYNYILMDGNLDYFTSASTILPFVQSAFSNQTFGVLAEGLGALLLQRNFTGAPELYNPLVSSFDSTNLTAYGSAQVVGSSISGSGPAFSIWYGPFITLYPGNYSVTFALSSNVSGPAIGQLVTLDAVYGSAGIVLSTMNVYGSNFTASGKEQLFEIDFHLSTVETDLQFRGMYSTGAATLTLYGVTLSQLSVH